MTGTEVSSAIVHMTAYSSRKTSKGRNPKIR
jgi:hypothetical protein